MLQCIFISLLLILAQAINYSSSESSSGILNVKNISAIESEKAKVPKPEENPFKKDVRKYSKECGADVSIEDEDTGVVEEMESQNKNRKNGQNSNGHWSYEGSQNRNKNKKGENNKGTYPTHYGSNESEEESDEDDDGNYDGHQSGRRRNSSRRYNNRHNHRHNQDYDGSDSQEECHDSSGYHSGHGSHGNRDQRRQSRPTYWYHDRRNNYPYKGYGNRYNGNSDRYGGNSDYYNRFYSDSDAGSDSYDPYWTQINRQGYSIYGGRMMALVKSRIRRQVNRNFSFKNSDAQCLSQCVFGYLEMLDDNRVPAETEVIRYIQSKITNNSERMKLIRQTRRCFAKLSTTELADSDDGCNFSKSLAQCLNIEIKGETT